MARSDFLLSSQPERFQMQVENLVWVSCVAVLPVRYRITSLGNTYHRRVARGEFTYTEGVH